MRLLSHQWPVFPYQWSLFRYSQLVSPYSPLVFPYLWPSFRSSRPVLFLFLYRVSLNLFIPFIFFIERIILSPSFSMYIVVSVSTSSRSLYSSLKT